MPDQTILGQYTVEEDIYEINDIRRGAKIKICIARSDPSSTAELAIKEMSSSELTNIIEKLKNSKPIVTKQPYSIQQTTVPATDNNGDDCDHLLTLLQKDLIYKPLNASSGQKYSHMLVITVEHDSATRQDTMCIPLSLTDGVYKATSGFHYVTAGNDAEQLRSQVLSTLESIAEMEKQPVSSELRYPGVERAACLIQDDELDGCFDCVIL